jgi:hypothetical protein
MAKKGLLGPQRLTGDNAIRKHKVLRVTHTQFKMQKKIPQSVRTGVNGLGMHVKACNVRYAGRHHLAAKTNLPHVYIMGVSEVWTGFEQGNIAALENVENRRGRRQ